MTQAARKAVLFGALVLVLVACGPTAEEKARAKTARTVDQAFASAVEACSAFFQTGALPAAVLLKGGVEGSGRTFSNTQVPDLPTRVSTQGPGSCLVSGRLGSIMSQIVLTETLKEQGWVQSGRQPFTGGGTRIRVSATQQNGTVILSRI